MCLGTQRLGSACCDDPRFFQKFQPISRLFEFLQSPFDLADEIGIGLGASCFAVLRTN